MDIEWLERQDPNFHIRAYRALLAQQAAFHQAGFSGYAAELQHKIDWLVNLGKIDPKSRTAVVAEVRAELSYVAAGWSEHIKTLGTG